MLRVVTPPSAPVVSVANLKKMLRIDYNEEDDFVLPLVLGAATKAFEERTDGVVLRPTILEWYQATFPSSVCIPAYPFRDVLSVKYIDADGNEQTVDPSEYFFMRTSEGATVRIVGDYSEPEVQDDNPEAFVLRFSAGYDYWSSVLTETAYSMPSSVLVAVTMLAGHFNEHREAVLSGAGANAAPVPLGFDWLASQSRIFR